MPPPTPPAVVHASLVIPPDHSVQIVNKDGQIAQVLRPCVDAPHLMVPVNAQSSSVHDVAATHSGISNRSLDDTILTYPSSVPLSQASNTRISQPRRMSADARLMQSHAPAAPVIQHLPGVDGIVAAQHHPPVNPHVDNKPANPGTVSRPMAVPIMQYGTPVQPSSTNPNQAASARPCAVPLMQFGGSFGSLPPSVVPQFQHMPPHCRSDSHIIQPVLPTQMTQHKALPTVINPTAAVQHGALVSHYTSSGGHSGATTQYSTVTSQVDAVPLVHHPTPATQSKLDSNAHLIALNSSLAMQRNAVPRMPYGSLSTQLNTVPTMPYGSLATQHNAVPTMPYGSLATQHNAIPVTHHGGTLTQASGVPIMQHGNLAAQANVPVTQHVSVPVTQYNGVTSATDTQSITVPPMQKSTSVPEANLTRTSKERQITLRDVINKAVVSLLLYGAILNIPFPII